MGMMLRVLLLGVAMISDMVVRAQDGATIVDPQLLGTTMVIRGSKQVVVFGGIGTNSTSPQNTLWSFDLGSRLWSAITPATETKPPGRLFHSAVLSPDTRYMIIYGGIACFQKIQIRSLDAHVKEYHMQQLSVEYANKNNGLTDIWSFDFSTKMWAEINPNRGAKIRKCVETESVEKLSSGAERKASLPL